MRTELMGEGTYAYECKEPGCWYCEMMGLKPPVVTNVPPKKREQPEVFIIPMAVFYGDPVKKIDHNLNLSAYEKRKMREVFRPRIAAGFMKHDKTY